MINVHTGWDPLEEIWLGDVWPKEFYEDLSPEVRKAFNIVTEWTKEDLDKIQSKFEELGVTVRRPYIDINNKDLYLDSITQKLIKPPICLRDYNAVIGDQLIFRSTDFPNLIEGYDEKHFFNPQGELYISGASLVKVGRDILFDSPVREQQPKDWIFKDFYYFEKNVISKFKNDYRIHYSTNGGHCDGCFMPIKFGVSLSTEYATGYDFFLPNWETVDFKKPSFWKYGMSNRDAVWEFPKWYVPDMNGMVRARFNEYLEQYCQTWIGQFTETYFEVNVVVIDEENLMCIGDEKNAYPYMKEIEKYGIKCHLVPFRTRSFWDGGLHCITLDTRRKGTLRDFYPERGDLGFKGITSNYFDSNEQFLEEFNNWKLSEGRE
jgi:glycine amidinotransferase